MSLKLFLFEGEQKTLSLAQLYKRIAHYLFRLPLEDMSARKDDLPGYESGGHLVRLDPVEQRLR
jgi:hypothetical protein